MKKQSILIMLLLVSQSAWSYSHVAKPENHSQKKKVSYSQQIRQKGYECGTQEIDNYEKYRGRLPTDEEMDAILDACVNQKFDSKS